MRTRVNRFLEWKELSNDDRSIVKFFPGAISIESYCPRLDKWTLLKNMTGRRLQFGVAVMEDKLIIVGGRDGLKTMNSVRYAKYIRLSRKFHINRFIRWTVWI